LTLKRNNRTFNEPAQHSVHWTLGILPQSQAVFYASAFSTSDGVPPSAPAPVTQTVGCLLGNHNWKWIREMSEFDTPEYKAEIERLDQISNDFLYGLRFCVMDTGRDHNFWDNHLLSFMSQDILQSCYSILSLARDGVRNPCKRELRFLLELAIKQCFIEQSLPNASVQIKVKKYKDLLNTSSISIKSQLELTLLSAQTKAEFLEDIGRFYGATSKYVHLTPDQVLERIALVSNGITAGKEGLSEIREMIQFLGKGYAMILVLIFHSVPSYIAGDFLVETDGTSNKWYFQASKYIAEIDSYFDYKHERQNQLEQIRRVRAENIKF